MSAARLCSSACTGNACGGSSVGARFGDVTAKTVRGQARRGTSFAEHLHRATSLWATPSEASAATALSRGPALRNTEDAKVGQSPSVCGCDGDPSEGKEGALTDRPRGHASSWDLDPLTRALAQGNPLPTGQLDPAVMSAPGPSTLQACPASSVERVFAALVRRVAWSGDARKGSVRIEIGTGRLSGAVLLVHADSGSVQVSMQLPTGSDPERWHDRIAKRLEERGLQVESLEIA